MNSTHLLLLLGVALCGCRSSRDRDRQHDASRYYGTTASSAGASSTGAYGTHTGTQAGTTGTAQEASWRRTSALSHEDRDFVNDAAQGGMFEVESSRLALTKNISQMHRDFAKMMVDDHSRANEKLDELVRRTGGSLPKTLESELQRELDELRSLDGSEFEHRYHDLQVEKHDEAIALFERAARSCDNEDLRRFANDTLPKLREHRKELARHE